MQVDYFKSSTIFLNKYSRFNLWMRKKKKIKSTKNKKPKIQFVMLENKMFVEK